MVESWLSADALIGAQVTLEPLRRDHIEPLAEAVRDGEAWRLWYANVPTPDQMAAYVETAIANARAGEIAYAVRHHTTSRIVGTTRFYAVEPAHRRACIGYTWYAAAVRRSAVNTESKVLLLKHLFERHRAIAVEFRTHVDNHASRAAIERLGAHLDGVLRSHQILRDGSIRDTAVYSMIAAEWPAVRTRLRERLRRSADDDLPPPG